MRIIYAQLGILNFPTGALHPRNHEQELLIADSSILAVVS